MILKHFVLGMTLRALVLGVWTAYGDSSLSPSTSRTSRSLDMVLSTPMCSAAGTLRHSLKTSCRSSGGTTKSRFSFFPSPDFLQRTLCSSKRNRIRFK